MASENYHQNPTAVRRRKQALDFILKQYRENPFNPDDPFIPLLALTYFDRFFSRLLMEVKREPSHAFLSFNLVDIPLQVTMLIAISCLSLAWKMRTVRFNLRELLDSLNFRNLPVVEVKKMELRIFSTLDWRMRSTTAFCFIDFFVSLLNIDNDSKQDLKRRVLNNVVKKMYTVIEFTKFRPSIVAASALIAESTSSGPRIDLRQAFAPYVNMVKS
ncbi:putative cyclin-D6-1 [Cornus florida]|uniref:putative cyclin-D6-1 n=1 Tax=Cornus florida TaxID=4283 RepID=UPI00289FFF38|nr:putative cyclin-D6-1 [Cornus florida]